MATQYKKCSRCGKSRPADKRYFQGDVTTHDGLSPACKPCRHKYDQRRDAIRKYDPKRRLRLRIAHNRNARRRGISGVLTLESVNVRYLTQKGKCWHCGKLITLEICDLDHVVTFASGGNNDIENVVCSCRKCNRSKSNRPLYDHACRLAIRGIQHPAAAALVIPIQDVFQGEAWN